MKASRRQGISATDEQTTTIATGECDSGHSGWGVGGEGSLLLCCTPDEKPLIDSNIFDFNIHMPP